MSFLVDTNVISELRKRERANPAVRAWFESLEEDEIHLSALTVGEIRRGIELVRRRDARQAVSLDRWLDELTESFDRQILSVDRAICRVWGLLNVPDPIPVVGGLLAATAISTGLTLATRNVSDIERTGVSWINPFEGTSG